MAVTHSTAARNAMADAVVDLLDGGTLEIQSSGGASVLATLALSATAFGAASSGTATANAITSDSSADATGTAAQAQLKDSLGNVVVTCSVTATGGGGDVTLDSVSITAGQTVNITSITYSAPA